MKKALKKPKPKEKKKKKEKPVDEPGGPWCLICNKPCTGKCEV
jgi:hypothetical protein